MIDPVPNLRVVMAQLNLLVGDIPGNTEKIVVAAREARDRWRADAIVFPELTVTGYPPGRFVASPRVSWARWNRPCGGFAPKSKG